VTPKEPTDLDTLAAYAEGYAEFAMKNIGRVPPTMLALSPEGLLHFIPEHMADERAKNDFANVGRLIWVERETSERRAPAKPRRSSADG
jgi:hypothetical protein